MCQQYNKQWGEFTQWEIYRDGAVVPASNWKIIHIWMESDVPLDGGSVHGVRSMHGEGLGEWNKHFNFHPITRV